MQMENGFCEYKKYNVSITANLSYIFITNTLYNKQITNTVPIGSKSTKTYHTNTVNKQ